MTSQKRPANSDWETSLALKARRTIRPSVAPPVTSYQPWSKIGSQSLRAPLADIQQPRQYLSPASSANPQREESLRRVCLTSDLKPPPGSQSGYRRPHAYVSRPAPTDSFPWGKPYKPAIRHAPHPDSKLCQNFHWVPYPLGLLPYDSWFVLHHRPEHTQGKSALCPACLKERKVTPHTRKLFLVAERLSWEDGITSIHDKSLNEELNWAVNHELGILDPFVEDPEQVPGGKHSRTNSFYPYQNEYEMKLALKYIFMTEDITETTWMLWIGTQLDLQKMLGGDEAQQSSKALKLDDDGLRILEKRSTRPKTPEIETIDLTDSPPPKAKPSIGTPTPSSSSNPRESSRIPAPPCKPTKGTTLAVPPGPAPFFNQQTRIVSYKTLQDFYGLLDKIERTSFVGALFLEAYAEKLRDDLCKACWLERNVNLDLY